MNTPNNDSMLKAVLAAMPAINQACHDLAVEAAQFLRERRMAELNVRASLQHAGRPYGGTETIQWHSLATFDSLNDASMALVEKEAAMHARCGLNAWDDHFRLVDAKGEALVPCEPVWPLRRLLKMLRDTEGHRNAHHPAGDGPFRVADGSDIWPELRQTGEGSRYIGLWSYVRLAGLERVRVYPGGA